MSFKYPAFGIMLIAYPVPHSTVTENGDERPLIVPPVLSPPTDNVIICGGNEVALGGGVTDGDGVASHPALLLPRVTRYVDRMPREQIFCGLYAVLSKVTIVSTIFPLQSILVTDGSGTISGVF